MQQENNPDPHPNSGLGLLSYPQPSEPQLCAALPQPDQPAVTETPPQSCNTAAVTQVKLELVWTVAADELFHGYTRMAVARG